MMLARVGEPLADHLLNVAQVASMLASRLRLGVRREAFLAGLFHDIGKADKGAQARIRDCHGSPGHEIISAVVSFELLRTIKLPLEQSFVITLAVLRHHYAMRDPNEALNEVRGWFVGEIEDPRELTDTLAYGLRLLYFEETPKFEWPRNYRKLEHRVREMQAAFEKFYSSVGLSLQARLLAGVLMIADTFVAGGVASEHERERKEKSLYKREVERFVRALL